MSASETYGKAAVTVPYVSVASFKAFPQYLDLASIVPGGTQSANDAELNNLLITASQWAADFVNMPLHAHIMNQNVLCRVKSDGTIVFHPAHNPVKYVSAFGYSYTPPTSASPFTAVTNFGVFIQDEVLVTLSYGLGPGFNSLQFSPPSISGSLYTTWTYVSGTPNTTLASSATSGASSVVVSDPTGILPGDVLRIWDPGVEEAVTVSSSYVQGSGVTTIPLAVPLVNAHASGINLGAIPASVREAVEFYTCALLARPASASEDPFPDTKTGISTRGQDAQLDGTGYVAEAYNSLRSYMRVR